MTSVTEYELRKIIYVISKTKQSATIFFSRESLQITKTKVKGFV
jgi:hypothetical protein